MQIKCHPGSAPRLTEAGDVERRLQNLFRNLGTKLFSQKARQKFQMKGETHHLHKFYSILSLLYLLHVRLITLKNMAAKKNDFRKGFQVRLQQVSYFVLLINSF